MNSIKDKRIYARVDGKTDRAIKRMSKSLRISPSEFIRRAVEDTIKLIKETEKSK